MGLPDWVFPAKGRHFILDARTRRISRAKCHRRIAVSNTVAYVTRLQPGELRARVVENLFAIVQIEC
jgi:hypothetical protein